MFDPMTLRLRAITALLLMLLAGSASADLVWVVADPANAYHKEFLASLGREDLPKGVELSFYAIGDPRAPARPELIVTLGEAAAAREAASVEAVLHVFITEAQFRALYPRGVPQGHGAIFLEQSLDRYVALVRAALPGVSRLLVPVGAPEGDELKPLREAADRAGIAVLSSAVASPDAMDDLLARADRARDAVLFLPAPSLRSNAMMKVAVVGAYRRQVPLIAYSEGLVKAGALMSVHSTVGLLARQVAEQVGRFSSERRFPPPGYPERFDVAVNYELAKSLGLHIPERSVLVKKMSEWGVGRGHD